MSFSTGLVEESRGFGRGGSVELKYFSIVNMAKVFVLFIIILIYIRLSSLLLQILKNIYFRPTDSMKN